MKRVHYSIKEICDRVPAGQIKKVNDELFRIFGCSHRSYFYIKRRDYVNMPEQIKTKVEELFVEMGFEKSEIFKIWEE